MKIRNKKVRLVLMTSILTSSIYISGFSPMQVSAASTGTVNGIGVNVRQDAGTQYGTYGTLSTGATVSVLGQKTGTDGKVWYQISGIVDGKNVTGYMRSDYVNVALDNVTSGQIVTFTGELCIREAPVNGNVIGYASTGRTASVNEVRFCNGKDWYNVTYEQTNGKIVTGWVSSAYATISQGSGTITPSNPAPAVPSGTPKTVDELVKAGFPQSYATKLADISTRHPQWQFVAYDTGLDWNTAVDNEAVFGRNLVSSYEGVYCRSIDSNAYDWKTNTWANLDGTGWYAVSREFLAHRMDPRNYLDDTYIFAFESLHYNSSQTVANVQNMMKGTFMASDATEPNGSALNYANTLYEIGKNLAISPYHLTARLKQEQGTKGTSSLISGNVSGYKNYFNYFNVGAYATSGMDKVTRGLETAKNYGWNTRYKSIYGGAELLAGEYVKIGQDTLYFQKFNVTGRNTYSHQYMTNVSAARSEASSMANGYADKNQAFVFTIPVFRNMPDTACGYVEKGNPNNYLKSLSISNVSLTPGFSGQTTSYSAIVSNSVSTVNVVASPIVGTSTISGQGQYNLKVGDNTIQISCTAQSGDVKTYAIHIYREAAPSNNQGGNSGSDSGSQNGNTSSGITSSTYKIGSFFTGVQPQTSVQAVLNGITANNCTVKVLKADGTENTGNVGTGNVVAVYANGKNIANYPVVIYGDLNGDGKISMADLVRMDRHLIGKITLSGPQLEAGDVNRKGDSISMGDIVALDKYLIGKRVIEQK